MIAFEQVSKQFDSRLVLRHVDFSIDQGEMVFLTGASGAGKSTMLRMIMGLERPSGGGVYIDKMKIARMSQALLARHRRQMGIIEQTPRFMQRYTVYDNVALPLMVLGYRSVDMKKRVQAALDKVGLLDRAQDYPAALSVGEQQRAAIARAVVSRPQMILADEPAGNLDPGLAKDIYQLFADFNSVGVSLLIATHDLSLIASMPYRILNIKNGKLVG